jgi:rubrerythrin
VNKADKKRLEELRAEIDQIRARNKKAKARKMLTCGWCGARRRVSSLKLIQTYFYIEPYSCTGGDYWKEGEKQYECPSCGKLMRDPGKDREYVLEGRQWDPKIGELAKHFGSVEREYKR